MKTEEEKRLERRKKKNKQYWDLFYDVDFPDRINALPDNHLLTSAEAAVFLDISPATLERWATSFEDNVPISQRIGFGRTAPRRYVKADLLAFQEREGAPLGALPRDKRKIRCFRDVADLALQLPYYLDEFERVVGLVEKQPLVVVIARLGVWKIVWLNAIEAASRNWSNLAEHRKHARDVSMVLNQSKRAVSAGLEGTVIAQEMTFPTDALNEEGDPPKPLRPPPL